MQTSASARKSSYKELFLINKSTYFALLQKLTPLEKSDIERMNKQTLLPEDDSIGMGNKSTDITAGQQGSNTSGASAMDQAPSTSSSISDQQSSVPLSTNTVSDVFGGEEDYDTLAKSQNATENINTTSDEDPVIENETEEELAKDLQQQDKQEREKRLDADLAEARAPDIPLAVENTNDLHEPVSAQASQTPLTGTNQDSLPGPPLPSIPKGKKGRHHMPHVVTLRHVPETLVTQVHGTHSSSPSSSTLPLTPTTSTLTKNVTERLKSNKKISSPPKSVTKPKPDQKSSSSKKNLHKCQECGAEFKADWSLFKHITSKHDDSEYAKEAIIARDNTIQANRSRLRSSRKTNTNEAMNSGPADVKTSSATAANMSKSSSPGTSSENIPISPKQTLKTSSKKSNASQKVNVEPYPKSNPAKAKKNRVIPEPEVGHKPENSKSSKNVIMDEAPPDLVRSSTAAGKKRSISNTLDQSSMPKKPSGTMIVSTRSNRGTKRSKSMFETTNKRSKSGESNNEEDNDDLETYHTNKSRKSKMDRKYDDSDSDDDYDSWKY